MKKTLKWVLIIFCVLLVLSVVIVLLRTTKDNSFDNNDISKNYVISGTWILNRVIEGEWNFVEAVDCTIGDVECNKIFCYVDSVKGQCIKAYCFASLDGTNNFGYAWHLICSEGVFDLDENEVVEVVFDEQRVSEDFYKFIHSNAMKVN